MSLLRIRDKYGKYFTVERPREDDLDIQEWPATTSLGSECISVLCGVEIFRNNKHKHFEFLGVRVTWGYEDKFVVMASKRIRALTNLRMCNSIRETWSYHVGRGLIVHQPGCWREHFPVINTVQGDGYWGTEV